MNVKRMSVPVFVVFVFVLCMSVSAVGAADCTCGDVCVNTTGWWRAGGTFNASETPIQAAVDNAADGDAVCVKDGAYTENVNVDKRLTIRSENGPDSTIVDAADPDANVFYVGVDYVNISGFTVKGATADERAGILLKYAEHCNISGNNALENKQGISLFRSNNNTITDNKASETDFGIALVSSSSNTITNNYASHTSGAGISLSENSRSNIVTGNNASYNIGGSGVALANSGNNTLRDNVMSGNRYNFDADGMSYSELDNDINLSNLVDGKPIYYLVDASDTVIDSATNAGTVYCIHCDNVTVKDLTLERNFFGIYFYNTSNSRVENNNISICNVGIALASSSNNNITGNDGNGGKSIGLWESSGNTIEGNNVCCGMDSPNVYLEGSDYNNITGNNASLGSEGIYLTSSDCNTITNNIASNNFGSFGNGISLTESSNNILTNNMMDKNKQNFYIGGGDISHFIQDIDTSNKADGRPIYYWVNKQNQQVPGDAGFVGIVSSRNITVSDTTNYGGILFANTTNSRVENVNASIQGSYGIRLFVSSDNTLSNNTVSNGKIVYGFFLCDSSNNSLSNNIVSAKSDPGVGFTLYTSSNNSISNNSVSNSGTGFVLQEGSDSNTITNNTASNMSDHDFFSSASYSNKITDLTICSYPTTISFIYDDGITIKSVTIPEHEDPAGKANIGKYVNIKGITVDSWILLNVSYNDTDVTNVEEASLRLYRSTDTDWVEIEGSGVNMAENHVYANVTAIGQIAAFGDPKTPVTIYVPDNYTTIQAAVDNASAGGTIIVRDGTYTENVNVAKQLTIRSENGSDSTIVDAADPDANVFYVGVDYVNISGFTVKGATSAEGAGILLKYAEHCNISGNNALENKQGISLFDSNNNTITNNKVSENSDFGIALVSSISNTITNNTASNNDGTGISLSENSRSNIVTGNNASYNIGGSGVALANSGNNTLRDNVMSGNRYNFDADGMSYSELDNDIDLSNLVDGKPIYYLVDASDTVIDSATNAGTVYCIHCDNVTVKDLTLERNFFGIYFYNTSNSRVENNNIRYCNVGIALASSSNNNITGNTGEGGNSIGLWESRGNTIEGNNVCDGMNNPNIYLMDSNYNNITGNNASKGDEGICLMGSDHNTITNNIASSNGFGAFGYGISLTESSNNTLTNNTMDENKQNFYIGGGDISHFIQDIDTSNTVDGRPIYYLLNQQNQRVPDDAGFVGIVNSRNITVSDTTNYDGILFANVTNSRVENVNASILGRYGIRLFFSSDNTLSNNIVNDGIIYGFALYDSSNNSLSNNSVLAESVESIGFLLETSSNNSISNNSVSNGGFGFFLQEGSDNTITNNTVSNMYDLDFYSHASYSNKITDLTICSYPTTISFIYDDGIEIKSVTNPEHEDPAGKANIGKYVNIKDITVDSWILLNVSYNDADVTNVEEASLRLYRSTDTGWVELEGSGVNTVENYVYANVTDPGQIAAFGNPKTPEATIYVPDNYTTIQAAVDNASAGGTIIVRDGTYTENVNVDKRLTIRSENGSDSTIVDAAYTDINVFNVGSVDYVNITGFTVKGATADERAGILLKYAEHCNISGNNALENKQGISLFRSNNNTITDNKASETDFGIALVSSSSNTITNNYASHTSGAGISLSENSRSNIVTGNNASYNIGGSGVALANSGNNTLRDNVMSGNRYNFDADGMSYSELDNDIDLSNLVDGKPIYYLVDASDTVIDSATNAGTVYCIHCDNVTVKDLTLERNFFGIYFYNTSNSRVENNNISICNVGIALASSSNNNITGNDGNGGKSIGLWESSGNTIEGNNVCCGMDSPNVYLEGSDYNNITGNNASLGSEGIYLTSSDCNTITNNIASNNFGSFGNGISLTESSNNILTNNMMDKNKQNFYIGGGDISHFIQDIDTSNKADGRPIYYWVNKQNQQVPGDAGFVGIVSSRNITVSDTTNYGGILFANTTNSRVENVNASIQGSYGIRLFVSSDNTLSNNTVSNGKIVYGFFLCDSSNNSLSNNIVSAKSDPGVGFTLYTSSNNSISNNNVSNSGTGFALQEGSHSNTITNNTVSDNSKWDFCSDDSYSNKITDLTICSYPTTISFIYDDGIKIKSVTIPEQEDPAGKVNIGKYVDIKDITVDSWILLNVSYNDADVTHVEEASLRLYRSTDTGWAEIAGSGVNTVENYVYANVTSFSQIAAFGDSKTPVTIYVPDNYTTIQAAVDNASAGGTIIVRDGTYTENVNVDKRLTIRSENGSDSTIVSAADYSYNVFKVTADYVTISGFTVTGATKDLDTSGIYLFDADYCDISDIKASNNGAGIFLFNSSNNTIKNNAVNSNEWTGISVEFSSNNTITSNIASTNGVGIVLGRFTSSNIVTNNTASNNHDGIRLYSSGNNKLTNNNASNNNYGIYLFHSSNNTFSGNTALNNTDVDFVSDEGSRDNSIADFTISRYPTTISFIYEHGIVIKAVTVPEPDPAGKANIGKYVNATNATEDSWILLSASYSDADITNVKEDSLRLYRWTGTDWAEIPGSAVNTVENYVYANVTSFSQIAAFGDSTIKPTPAPTPAPRRGGGGGGSSGPCDTDGDGYGDIDELIMGTDPYDPCDPDPTCIACLASIGGMVLPKPAVKPQATPKLARTPEPVRAPTSRPAPTPVPEPEKPVIPGFEAVFAVVGLLAVAYLMRRKKK